MELDKDLKARQEARDLAKASAVAQKQLAAMSQAQLDAITEANWQMIPLHIEFQGAHVIDEA